jgi:hypothetical protein
MPKSNVATRVPIFAAPNVKSSVKGIVNAVIVEMEVPGRWECMNEQRLSLNMQDGHHADLERASTHQRNSAMKWAQEAQKERHSCGLNPSAASPSKGNSHKEKGARRVSL